MDERTDQQTTPPEKSQAQAYQPHKISQLARRTLIIVGIVALVVILLWFTWNALEILTLIFSGILLATFLRSLSEPLQNASRLPHGCALGLVSVILLLVLVGGMVLLYPQLEVQFRQLAETLPNSWLTLQRELRQYEWGQRMLEQTVTLDDLLRERSVVVEGVTGIFSSTVGAIISFAIVLFVSFYFALQPDLYINGLLSLVPLHNRKRIQEVISECGLTLKWWLLGRAIAMASVGIMISIGLGILGIPLALALGFLAAILDFIPNIGPLLATLPAILIALGQSPIKALYVILLYIIIQQIESYLITPIIQQRTIHLPPALTIIAQVLLTLILGAVGLVIATPLMAVLIVIVRMLYVEDMLGDQLPPIEKKDRLIRVIKKKVASVKPAKKNTQ